MRSGRHLPEPEAGVPQRGCPHAQLVQKAGRASWLGEEGGRRVLQADRAAFWGVLCLIREDHWGGIQEGSLLNF